MSAYSQRKLRVGFAGTPDFAVATLAAIVGTGFPVPLVLTRPDRPQGRGLKVEASPVARFCEAHGLRVAKPAGLKAAADAEALARVPLDVLVVAAYGLIVPPAVLAWPVHGCINVHASLLPRWRGAAPIQRAIDAGDAVSGVTIMRMDAGLDTGPTIARVEVALAPRETGGSLHDKLAAAGAKAILDVLDRLERDGRLDATPQPPEGATYAPKLGAADLALDWRRDADSLDRRIRALDPAPGASARCGSIALKIRAAHPLPVTVEEAAGTVLAAVPEGIDVACGEAGRGGVLRIVELQSAGGKRMDAAAFLRGHAIVPGMRFDLPSEDAPGR